MNRLLGVALAFAACQAPPPPPPMEPPPPPCLELPEFIDLGEAPNNVPIERSFELVNEGSAPLGVALSGLEAPFSSNLSVGRILAAGERFVLKVAVASPDSKLRQARATFVRGAACSPQEVVIVGRGEGSLEPDTNQLLFGFLPVGVPATKTLRVQNSRRFPVALELVGMLSRTYSIPPGTVVPPQGWLDLPVSVTPGRTLQLDGTLVVNGRVQPPSPQAGALSDQLTLAVRAVAGVPSVELETTSVSFTYAPLNGSRGDDFVERRITFTNRGDVGAFIDLLPGGRSDAGIGRADAGPLPLLPDGGVPPELQLFVGALAGGPQGSFLGPGETGFIDFRVGARRLGLAQETVTFVSQDPLRPTHVITVSAVGVPLVSCPAPVEVSPTSITASNVTFPTTVELRFTNHSNVPCLVDNLRTTDPRWAFAPDDRQLLLGPDGGTELRRLEVGAASTFAVEWATWRSRVTFLPFEGSLPVSLGP